MKKKEIVLEFLKSGYSLDTGSLDFFSKNQEKIQEFLINVKTCGLEWSPITTLEFVNTVLGVGPQIITPKDAATQSTRPETIKKFFAQERKKKMPIDRVLSMFASHYDDYRVAISDKLKNTLSINRVQNQSEFSVIVVIREKSGDASAVVEDPTGEMVVNIVNGVGGNEIIEGDVVGLFCEKRSGHVYVKRVVFPDIPLKRNVGTAERDVVYTFTPEKIDDNMLAEVAGVKILFCKWKKIKKYAELWGSTENVVVNLLKRRTLSPGAEIGSDSFWSDNTFLDIAPDIFVTDNTEDVMTSNYKGVTIISVGAWTVNLRTREINKVDSS